MRPHAHTQIKWAQLKQLLRTSCLQAWPTSARKHSLASLAMKEYQLTWIISHYLRP